VTAPATVLHMVPPSPDPVAQLLDYAHEHSRILAGIGKELEHLTAAQTATVGTHAAHDSRIRAVETDLAGLKARLGVWQAVAGTASGVAVTLITTALTGRFG
jgi:hypothetical protein